jgi:polar amino acid transport system substrate-binding protein
MADLFRRAFALAVMALGPVATPAFALTLLTEENPPFNYTDGGKLVGMATEIVNEMAKRAGVPVRTEVLQWDVGYRRAQAERDTCLFATARLENRERLFRWIGPIGVNLWGVFGAADFAGSVKTLTDLKGYRIGGVISDAKVEYLKENFVSNILQVPEDRLNPPRLQLPKGDPDRIDLWITGIYAARDVARAAKVGDLKLVLIAREIPLYLACSPQTRPEQVTALGAALEAINADGTQRRIIADYERRFAQ